MEEPGFLKRNPDPQSFSAAEVPPGCRNKADLETQSKYPLTTTFILFSKLMIFSLTMNWFDTLGANVVGQP